MSQWRLDTKNQTLVLSSVSDRLPSVVYWGARLPNNESLDDLIEATKKDWGDNLLDKVLKQNMLKPYPDINSIPD